MVKKGAPYLSQYRKGGGGGQEINAHLLSSTWLNNVPINIYSEVERARERPPSKLHSFTEHSALSVHSWTIIEVQLSNVSIVTAKACQKVN